MDSPSALPSLFTGIDARIPQILTPTMRRGLLILEAARPMGLTRVQNGWRGLAGFVSHRTGVQLRAEAFARIDYNGRHPRLKITTRGQEAIAKATAR